VRCLKLLTAAPRIVRHSDELLKVIRDRVSELNTTHVSVEAVSGLQNGYLSKVIGRDSDAERLGRNIWLLRHLDAKAASFVDRARYIPIPPKTTVGALAIASARSNALL